MSRLRSAITASFSFLAAALLLSTGARAQSGDVVITAATTWPTATYSVTSLTVQGGAVLTIGGGSTVTVASGVSVAGNSAIVLQSINNTGKVNGVYAGAGVTLQAGTVQVASGSSINADEQGYLSSALRAESDGGSGGAGGSYGGLGGYTSGTTYGSAAMPVDLGSGGASGQYVGSNGGGALRLIVSGLLTNNGTISANGQAVLPSQGGAGAGGSVWVTAGSLAGAGTFTANGGTNKTPQLSGSAAGGGGRVAVYYAGPTTFTGFSASTAAGGVYTGSQAGYAGSDGTAVFIDTSVANGNVSIYASGFQLPANSTVKYNSLTIANHAAVSIGSGSTVSVATGLTVGGGSVLTIGGGSTVTVANGVSVTGNSSIVMQSINNAGKVNGAFVGAGVTLQAGTVQVDSGSAINADGQGYLSSARRSESDGGGGGAGGSYGGLGGYTSGTTYGSAAMPVDLGSGGASGQYVGSNGGGAIRLIVSGLLTNNGTISANGQAVLPNQGGAGAGGSVWVTAGSLAGAGTFTANGGTNKTPQLSGSAAGGGGRVAVYYAGPTTFTGFSASTATGGVYTGTATGYAGSDGTAVFIDTSAPNGNVSVYAGGFQVPANSTVQYNSITIANHAAVSIGSGSTVSVATSLTVGGGAVLSIGGGSTVTVANGVSVTGNSSIVLQSINNAGKVNGAFAGAGVTLQAGTVQVDAGSSINADGQGYLSSARRVESDGGGGSSGGSYGGLGGYTPGVTYGSAAMPVDLGSGGAAGQYFGSNGGGALRLIVSGLLTNNGAISANGQANLFCTYGGCGGGGAGGSVYVTAASLAGSGNFTANGGSNTIPTNNGSAAGGGGRVAVYYKGPTTFTGFAASTASGGVYTGTTTGYAGSNGTAIFVDTSAPNGNASIYQHFEVLPNASVAYNALTVTNGASLVLGGGSQLSVTQAMRVTGAVTALATNNTAQVNAKWVGKGVIIAAGSMQIDATGSISADAQGYPANLGPGAGGYTNGGSYGGAGGGQDATTIYGSVTSPVDLGSGGGGGQNTGGGTGGGAVELLIAATLQNDGVISANGGSLTQSGYGGAGAGGSIFVQTHTLQGAGTMAANGGSNLSPGAAGYGGGGGRISVNYLLNSGVARSSLGVNGGTGAIAGGVGTVSFVQAAGLQWLQPSKAAVHGATALQWTANTGSVTTVTTAGPQTATLATSGVGISNATWDTTTFPDGAYELRLTASDSTGVIGSVVKSVVVNNSVLWVSGTLTANTHWTANNVYALEGNLTIPNGVTLTIDAGTVIKSLDNFQILVQNGGTLTSLGTSAAPVIFTTFDDPTAGGNTSFGTGSPQAGDWGGVSVAGGGTFNTNVNTFVRYGHGVVGSTLTADTTLLSSQAYEISGTLTVPSGITLTVQPGAVLKFDAGAGMFVNAGGKLIANGTQAQPIYMTSINDQSVGANLILYANPSATLTAAAPGDWNSIHIEGTASFNHVHILYGGGPIPTVNQEGMLESAGNATITLANSTLAYSYYIGIQTQLAGSGDTWNISNTVFFNNQERAINVYPNSSVHVVNSTFDGNAGGPFNHGGSMDISNSVITNFFSSQFGGVGGYVGTFLNNDVWTPVQGVPNYSYGAGDQTGSNGNISFNPVFVNAAQHDYRPNYGSPLIDAANGTVANYPATDAYGDPRYNAPLVTAKKGTPDANGKYPDIGAFEFVQSAPSNLDLTPSAVQGPAAAVVGTQAQVTWTVTNIGTGTAYGPWHDAVYLVRDPLTNPVEIYAGEVLSAQNVVLGPGASYSDTGTVTVPGTIVGPHAWEVRTNVRGEVFEGINTANNKAVSLNKVQIDVPVVSTSGGTLSGTFALSGQAAYYKLVTTSSSQPTKVQLALLPPAVGSVQLYVGGGYAPSPQHYDFQSLEFNSATATVLVPAGTAQTYYITAYPQQLAVSPTAFTIAASSVSFALTGVNPASAPTGARATVFFTGGNFTNHTTFSLVSSGGVSYSPSLVSLTDPNNAALTFDLTRVPAGSYTAQAVDGQTLTLRGAFTVTSTGTTNTVVTNSPQVDVTLETPAAFRAGFASIVTLNYRSTASSDIPAPLIYLAADNATLSPIQPPCDGCDPNYALKLNNTFNSGLLLGINHDGPAGVLPAGASGSLQFMATPSSTSTVQFSASALPLDPVASGYTPLVCAPQGGALQVICNASTQTGAFKSAIELCASLAPASNNNAGFTRACAQMLNNAGFRFTPFVYLSLGLNIGSLPSSGTPDGFVGPYLPLAKWNKLLADDATALSAAGIYEPDAQKVLTYELQKDGMAELSARYHQGAYGYGASHPFDIVLTLVNGMPSITYPDGSIRTFATPGTTTGTFLGGVGDYATITRDPNSSAFNWLLTEANGLQYHFVQNGNSSLLDYIQDHAGNREQMTYTGGLLTSITDAYGGTATFTYDSLNHIVSYKDFVGRVTTYTYHSYPFLRGNGQFNSTFLQSVTDNSGTTTFTWMNEGPEASVTMTDDCIPTFCHPAIGVTSIAYPDGTHDLFSYDALGRVTGKSRDNNAEAITYTYNDDGSVTYTNALGKSATLQRNANGNITAQIDPLGNTARFRYNAESELVNAIGPLGGSFSSGYDGQGNVSSLTSALGSLTSASYNAQQVLQSVTDGNGNSQGFTYSNTNQTAKTSANGTAINGTYDSNGRLLTRTNRRGNTTTFTYGSNGLLSSKTFANGSSVQYTYDAHGNLGTVTTAAGTTTYTFDSADRMTGVTNPDGSGLVYTYNSGGQRTRMTDSTGFVTNYTYDAAGRIATVANGSNTTIATYTYDAAGHLATKKLANGTTATYTYDDRGLLLSVANRTAAQTLLSEYDYTYDAEANPVTMTSPAGASTFSYDLDGQLVSATGPVGSAQYTYDAAGNRTQAVSNGVTRAYSPNNLNQYATAGSSAYQYDADGNLIAGDGWTYTYDDDNHLVAMTKPGDSWTFQYDGMNYRVGSVHNGTATRYLLDAQGLGSVVAELDSHNQPVTHYIYGIDLAGAIQASGTASYYHFDGSGNTAQMTDASGAIVNSYAYQPYGEKTVLASAVNNPFTYNGRFGVRDEGTGLYQMHNRWYNPSLGRFQQLDPAGFVDGPNEYRYARNSPIKLSDPLGLYTGTSGTGNPLPEADYFTVSFSLFVSFSTTINAHNGNITLTPGFSGGAGVNYAVGHVVGLPAGADRAAATDGLTGGWGSNVSAYAVAGGGISTSLDGGATALEGGGGYGGRGGSIGYGIQPHGFVQDAFTGANYSLGGKLFGTDPSNPFGPRVLAGGPAAQIGLLNRPPRPCGSCLTKPGKKHPVPVNGSIDPNGKLTSGYGDSGFIPTGAPITYTITFENLPTATLPAQKVVVTDALPSNLDWSTVQLKQVNFNSVSLQIPDGTQTYKAQANVATDPNPVSVAASLNPTTGVLTWTINSVSATTGGAPANPLAGFLPPNDSNNAGAGSVVFTVLPKAGLPNATAITNTGSIVFDVNASILTNSVTNTIDSSAVTSAIAPLPATTLANAADTLPVTWSGTDAGGSGIAWYDIYAAVDQGQFLLWLSGTTNTSATYSYAYPGHSYSFVSMATNNVGITQAKMGAVQTTTVALQTPVVTVTPASTTITSTQALSLAIAVSGNGTPTGMVTLAGGTFTSATVPLSGGQATIVIPAGSLPAGTTALTATYSPDAASALVFQSASGTAAVTVSSSVSTVQVQVGTTPAGLSFTVDGTAYTAAQTFNWTAGSTHTLATTTPQNVGGVQQSFTAWSDGGAITHTVTAAAGTSYTATFATTPLPAITLTPSTLTFTATSGLTSAAQTVQLADTGTAVLTLNSITLTGTGATAFTQTNNCGATLAPGTNCTVAITFAPTAAANYQATLNVSSNAAAAAAVSLSGTVTAAPTSPALTLTPSSLSFTATSGITSAAQTVQLTSTGSAVLALNSLSLTGTGSTAFTQTNNCGTTLAPGASCTVAITFAPTAAATYLATLNISSNATGTAAVSLSGTGTAAPNFTLGVTPASQTVARGGTATYTVSATPQGGAFTGTITLAASGLPTGAVATFAPASLTLGAAAASSTLTIRVPATNAGLSPAERSKALPLSALLGCLLLATQRRRRLARGLAMMLALLFMVSGLSGCGTSNGSTAVIAPTTSTITITATSGTQTQNTTVSLVVTQ